MKRLAAGASLGILFLVLTPQPAGADPARPTNYVSEVTSVDPVVGGVEVGVVGGDAFLTIEVAPGTALEVPGYEGEPYVRISETGEVTVNVNSPTHWVNEDRFGQVAVPAGATAVNAPNWVSVGTDGVYGWHDHRIHWMSPEPPPAVDRSSRSPVFDWVVPIVVDGEPVHVSGSLVWLPDRPMWPGLALLLIAGVVAFRFPRTILLAAAGLAVAVGIGQALESPLGAGEEVLAWAPPVVGLVVALSAVRWLRYGPTLLALTAVVLLVWGGIRFGALWLPVLPSPVPEIVERVAVAMAVGGGAGAVVGVYRRLGRQAPPPAVAH